MSTDSKSKAICVTEILSNGPISMISGEPNYLLTLKAPLAFTAFPGQFLQIRVATTPDQTQSELIFDGETPTIWKNIEPELRDKQPVLNRPFSLAGVYRRQKYTELHVLYRVRGPGTRHLRALAVGTTLTVFGPLGQSGFTMPAKLTHAIVAGDGLGVAGTLNWLATLTTHNIQTTVIIGAPDASQLPVPVPLRTESPNVDPTTLPECFRAIVAPCVKLRLSTDDGSAGLKGFVSHAVEDVVRSLPVGESPAIFTCGPMPMLKSVVLLARKYNLPCQVSLEEMMACGIGTCQACVIRVPSDVNPAGEYRLCCKHGPVFQADDILWD